LWGGGLTSLLSDLTPSIIAAGHSWHSPFFNRVFPSSEQVFSDTEHAFIGRGANLALSPSKIYDEENEKIRGLS